MSTLALLALVLAVVAAAYRTGTRRALATVGGNGRQLHSLPTYHCIWLALWCGVPALLLLAAWAAADERVVAWLLVGVLPVGGVSDVFCWSFTVMRADVDMVPTRARTLLLPPTAAVPVRVRKLEPSKKPSRVSSTL